MGMPSLFDIGIRTSKSGSRGHCLVCQEHQGLDRKDGGWTDYESAKQWLISHAKKDHNDSVEFKGLVGA